MYVWILLVLIVLFHGVLYYWDMDLPKRHSVDWTETKVTLENHLKELKQYSHG